MLEIAEKKRFSKKINYEAIDGIFGDERRPPLWNSGFWAKFLEVFFFDTEWSRDGVSRLGADLERARTTRRLRGAGCLLEDHSRESDQIERKRMRNETSRYTRVE